MKEYEQKIYNIINNAEEDVIFQAHQAYKQGYEDGKAATPFTDTEEKAYNRGLNDAWDAARKIAQTYAHFTCYDLNKIFGDRDSVGRKMIFEEYTPQDAIRKIKEYEDKQKQDAEIKVGDEVTHDGAKFIVLNIDSQTCVYCLDTRGRTPIFTNIHNLTKTGRHFPQIAEILAEMRGAENDE